MKMITMIMAMISTIPRMMVLIWMTTTIISLFEVLYYQFLFGSSKFSISSLNFAVSLGIGSYGVHDGDRLRRHFP